MVINNFLFYNFLKILFESCLYVLNYIHVKESYKLESSLDKSSRFFVIGLVILHFLILTNSSDDFTNLFH